LCAWPAAVSPWFSSSLAESGFESVDALLVLPSLAYPFIATNLIARFDGAIVASHSSPSATSDNSRNS
jgi:hypothetical protein